MQASFHENNPCLNMRCCDTCAFDYLSHKIHAKDVSETSLRCPGCVEPLSSTDVHRVLNGIRIQAVERTDLLARYNDAMAAQSQIERSRDKRLQSFFPNINDTFDDLNLSCWSMNNDTRRCPGCRFLIEKNGGCQHMTCIKCRHEFWWCCGQSYRNSKHWELLCAPIVYVNHRHPYWGPNLFIRTFTKTGVGVVGLGVGTVAGALALVVVPAYLLCFKIKNKYKDIMHQRQQERLDRERERIRLVNAQQAEYQYITSQDENIDKFVASVDRFGYSRRLQQASGNSSSISDEEPTAAAVESQVYTGYIPLANRWQHKLVMDDVKKALITQ
jgi:hypothetical protein